MAMNETKKLIAIGRSRYLFDAIKHLHESGYEFSAVVTDEAYEEYEVKHTDFESLSNDIGAQFFLTKSVTKEEIKALVIKDQVRIGISANWRYVIPKDFLDLFSLGILNFHLGNLPDYKGNATVNWSIINGESFIFGNVHKMDERLDVGDVIARKKIAIAFDTYVGEIIKQAEEDAPALYASAVSRLLNSPSDYEIKGQVEGLRCYPRLPEDSQINWHQSSEQVCRLVRASSHPYRGAFTFLDGERVVIWRAKSIESKERFLAVPGHVIAVNASAGVIQVACGRGILEVQEIERNGVVTAPTDFIRSIRSRFKSP
jgi:methionyl-tRNA formyltransferase